MRYSGAQILIRLLQEHGIKNIPGIPGGANLPIYKALYDSKIDHILTRHEQGAGFIAQGMARSTGKAAVCLATSGPGATNLITAIADAKLDSVPLIAITGQVPTPFLGTDAFQEIDTYGLSIPITKHNFLVRSAEDLLKIIPQAFKIAESGRPGPVWIDIPKDVQLGEIQVDKFPGKKEVGILGKPSKEKLSHIAGLIKKSRKPILYIGGGILKAKANDFLLKFAEKNSIPVVSTLMGLGCVPAKHPLFAGMLGMHGARYTNLLLEETDLLLAFGVRFDDRATGNIKNFCNKAKIVHIDIDRAELNKLKSTDICMAADIRMSLRELIPLTGADSRKEWLKRIESYKSRYPHFEADKKHFFRPQNFIRYISELIVEESIIVTDVGQHQMWVAQGYPFNKPGTLLTSGGLGTMGFGLPVAIGAALSNPDKDIVCFTGDGSLLMNVQELATLKDLDLNIKILLMNNGHLGLVRQQQELFYEEKYIATQFNGNPNFCELAKSFGIKGYRLGKYKNPKKELKRIFSKKGPCLIDIPIHYREKVFPMVAPGKSNKEMIGG